MSDPPDILRLPKPISNCDIRPELLSFSGDRRWDLLGFVRPEEIEEIKVCNVDDAGNRYYLVHWRDSWKPESSLIYCEKMMQQFWAQKSLIQQQQDSNQASALDSRTKSQNDTNRNNEIPVEASPLELSSFQPSNQSTPTGNQASQVYPSPVHSNTLQTTTSSREAIGCDLEKDNLGTISTLNKSEITLPYKENKLQQHLQPPLLPTRNEHARQQYQAAPTMQKAQQQHQLSLSPSLQQQSQSPLQEQQQQNQETDQNFTTQQQQQGSDSNLLQQQQNQQFDPQQQSQPHSSPLQQLPLQHPEVQQKHSKQETQDKRGLNQDTLEESQGTQFVNEQLVQKKDELNKKHEKVHEHTSEIDQEESELKMDHSEVNFSISSPSTISSDNQDNGLTNTFVSEILSKKGASKRKNRLPRQSVPSPLSKTKKEKSKKSKTKGKKKICNKGKIAKMVNTVISSNSPSKMINYKIGRSGVLVLDGSIDNRGLEEGVVNGNVTNEKGGGSVNSGGGNLKCMLCDKLLTSQQNLMKHLLTHNNNHTCTVCMKTFKSTHFLKHHMDKHNEAYLYSCPVCQKKFKFKNNMRGHLRKHNMEKKFQCEVCQKKFIGKYNLKEHMKVHSDERPFECDFCPKRYKDRGALNKHLLSHQDKKIECELCHKQFSNKSQVKRHMQYHMSWPEDSCATTGKKTSSPSTGEKRKYTCTYCEKTFNHYSNMNAHIHKQHKEKKIQCTECSKTFAYQYELREHMFIHANGKQEASKFKCKYCDKCFQRSTTLKNHEQTTHLGIKRFKCEICDKLFGTKYNMKVHVEKLHSENSVSNGNINPNKRPQKLILPNSAPTTSGEFVASDVPEHAQSTLSTMTQVSMPNPLLQTLSTRDIIRNAITNMPELGYFPGLSANPPRGYQFYGLPAPDFGVS